MPSRVFIAVCLACFLVASGALGGRSWARAQDAPLPDSSTQSEYDTVLARALTFHAQGDYGAARASMERAHVLEPSARTLRGLGIVALAQGQHLVAMRFLDQALASPVKALPAELRASVEQLREQIWSLVGRYEVRVDPDSAQLSIDGEPPDYYAPKVLLLEPGAHTLQARDTARGVHEVELDVVAGAREILHVVLGAVPVPVASTQLPSVELASRPRTVDDSQETRGWSPALRYGGLGIGSALVLGGATLWATGRVRLDQVVQACRDTAIGACTREQARRRYDDKQIGQLFISSAVMVGTGVALLVSVAAVEIYLLRHRKHTVHAQVAPSALGLRFAF